MNPAATYQSIAPSRAPVMTYLPAPSYGPQEHTTSLGTKIGYIALAVIGVGGVIYFGKKWIDHLVSGAAHAKSFTDGSAETIAKQIKMAFENDGYWGTDLPALRSALTHVESQQQMQQVYDAYKREYTRNLYEDLQSELQTSEYNEMLQIIKGKPEKTGQSVPVASVQYLAWAKRLKAAFDKSYGPFPGTDNAAIRAVFNEIPTQSAFIQVGAAYIREYGQSLIDALKSELEFSEYPEMMAIIVHKPK